MNNALFPMSEAYHELSTYRVMVDDALKCRIVFTHDTNGEMILVHIEPQEDTSLEYLWEESECYADDISEWFALSYPTLEVRFIERDEDWFVLMVTEK